MNDFIVPPNHFKFKAKSLSNKIDGDILECAVAYIEPQGGGPEPSHTHQHNHLFIVVEGCAIIRMGEEEIKVYTDESILVDGEILHSVWNKSDKPLKMIGITLNN